VCSFKLGLELGTIKPGKMSRTKEPKNTHKNQNHPEKPTPIEKKKNKQRKKKKKRKKSSSHTSQTEKGKVYPVFSTYYTGQVPLGRRAAPALEPGDRALPPPLNAHCLLAA